MSQINPMPNPEQTQTNPPESLISDEVLHHSASMNEQRIQEHAHFSFYRTLWDTYKGHVRGMLAGIATGAAVGTAIGIAVAGALACFGAPILATIGAGSLISTFAGAGVLFGAEEFGAVGAAAASRASALAEKHARLLDPSHNGDKLAELDDKLMVDSRGHHYEYPQGRDKGKFFVWKSGLVGAGLCAAAGALLSSHEGLLTAFGLNNTFLAAAFGSSLGGPAALAAIGLGLIGLTFGVERGVFKTLFNQTDANIQGKLSHDSNAIDPGREQAFGQERENEASLSAHRLRRQADINGLEKEYNEKISHGGINGLFRGLAGGVATGALIGLAVGVIAFGIACLPYLAGAEAAWTTLHISAMSLLGTLMSSFAGTGAMLGMKVFTQAGMEAGAETTARSIDTEFARNGELRARGITPPVQPPAQKEWFSWRTALITAAVGAAIGSAICSVILGGLGGIGLIDAAATMSEMIITGGVAGGLLGMTYGIGNSVWKAIGKGTDWVYDHSYIGAKDPGPGLQAAIAALQEKSATPLYGNVTPEETARLNARLDKARNFVQSVTAQSQAAPASLGV